MRTQFKKDLINISKCHALILFQSQSFISQHIIVMQRELQPYIFQQNQKKTGPSFHKFFFHLHRSFIMSLKQNPVLSHFSIQISNKLKIVWVINLTLFHTKYNQGINQLSSLTDLSHILTQSDTQTYHKTFKAHSQ